MNFFFPIEWMNRELESRLLLTISLLAHSKNKKIKIYLGNQKKLGKITEKLNNYYLWLATGIDGQLEFYKKLLNSKGVMASLDEEGGIFTKNDNKILPRHEIHHEYAHLVSKIFIWGNEVARKIKKKYKKNKKNSLVVSGNPRFDLAKKKFKLYFNNPKLKKDVLINTAFSMSNPDVDHQKEKLFWNSRAATKKWADITYNDNFDNTVKYQTKNFKLFLKDIKRLAEKYNNLTYGIRNHPSESKKLYTNYFKNVKNIEIMDNTHSVLYNIFNSNVIIHPGCTSAVETFFSGKKTICHINNRDKGNEQYVPVKISDLSRNYNQLENLFYNHLKKNKVDKRKNNESKVFLSNHIFNLSLDSHKIIAKELLKIDLKNENLKMIKEMSKLKEKPF